MKSCSMGNSVPWEILFHGKFCSMGNSVPWEILFRGKFFDKDKEGKSLPMHLDQCGSMWMGWIVMIDWIRQA